MPFTPEELEAIRQADEALEREWVEDATERAINAEIDKWADEQAMLDLLDKRGRAVWRYKRKYYEAHKDEIAAYQREYRREYRKGRRR